METFGFDIAFSPKRSMNLWFQALKDNVSVMLHFIQVLSILIDPFSLPCSFILALMAGELLMI